MNNQDIVRTARKYLGVPWKHQGRNPAVGLDCVGLPICIAKDLGLEYEDLKGYTMRPRPQDLLRVLNSCCDQVTSGPVREGDLLVFFFIGKGWPQHLAVKTDKGMIHTTRSGLGRVMEEKISDEWARRYYGAWRYKWPQ